MITIKTDSLEKKSEEVPTKSDTTSETENLLKVATEKIAELQGLFNSKEKELQELKDSSIVPPEQLIRKVLNQDGRIHEYVLKYILNLNELDTKITIGSINLRRVFLGDGQYELLS